MKIKVAVTGGIGSGKSSVLAILKLLGYPAYSCDEIYKNLIKNEAYIKTIDKLFGCVEKGVIQTDKLSNLVFSNPEKRRALNDVAHPLIMKELLETMENAPANVVFAEVPLLFEGNYESLFDKILVILREKSARVSSVENRDALKKEQILARINAQIDYDSIAVQTMLKEKGAHFIQNEGDFTLLKNKVEEFVKNLQT